MKKLTIVDAVEEIMQDEKEYTIYEVRAILIKEYNKFHSDGTVSRAMRSLRDRGYELDWKFKTGSSTTIYWVRKLNQFKQGELI